MKAYPCKGLERRLPQRSQAPCAVCGARAIFVLDIEVTHMRGDDDRYKVCRDCQRLPAAEIQRRAEQRVAADLRRLKERGASVNRELHRGARREALANPRLVHGKNCRKVPHAPLDTLAAGAAYLHGAEDDGPFSVAGATYCGRCHRAL